MTVTMGHLPHVSQRQKLYAVTFRLHDSLPKDVTLSYMNECTARYGEKEPDFKSKREILLHKKMMEYMDMGHGECLLKYPDVRIIIEEAFRYVHDKMALVHAYVIMPNHIHIVLETKEEVKIQEVMHNLKRYTASKINKLLLREGNVWQREYYDRVIRNQTHYENAVKYIINNPRHCKSDEYSLGGMALGGQVCNLPISEKKNAIRDIGQVTNLPSQ